MQNKWDGWYESLPKHTQEYLIDKAIWRDIDLLKFTAIAFAVGFLVGYIL
jgi:hypothetical protein